MSAPSKPRGLRPLLFVTASIILSIGLCCGGCGLFAFLGTRQGKADIEVAKGFARTALLKVGKQWSPDDLKPVATRTWNTFQTEEQTRTLFTKLSTQLGPLKDLGAWSARDYSFKATSNTPMAVRVQLHATGTFEKGSAPVDVTVAKMDGNWGLEKLTLGSATYFKK